MTDRGNSEAPQTLTPQRVAMVRRRMGFVALLWWISAGFGTIGVMQGMQASRVRFLFIGVGWVLAIFFSYAWWQLRKGQLPE